MGIAISSPCCYPVSKKSSKLVFWEGTTRIVAGKCLAGEIMFQFPDRVVCRADSFYIGQEIPALSIDDELARGETYFVLPVDLFACRVLSAKSLSALASSASNRVNFGNAAPFEYLKGRNGRMLIRVSPEFITGIIFSAAAAAEKTAGGADLQTCRNGSTSPLCSTPELQKHYAMLVGSREQLWSPKLETIVEKRKATSLSPYRLLGLDWRSDKLEGYIASIMQLDHD
ncbi:hypothetical protein H6P81_004149 [Aristolochia fimbriata]|uniref:Uncharacterized protein n=1 Tax=Aristolochia fimbriata TaxID=158543 RepID=A0AAV7FHA0_ARIFI|nr:hypothetical protein H6P81_004149 [Aristolochia fimbriata]